MTQLTPAELQEQLDKSPSPLRVTKPLIESRIKETEYLQWPGTNHTLCMIKLDNGFTVIGTSCCVSEKNYNADVGQTLAHENAFDQLWSYFAFMLAEMSQAAQIQGVENALFVALGSQEGR
jgi:hypothetical protein